jgi:hypothetical protein
VDKPKAPEFDEWLIEWSRSIPPGNGMTVGEICEASHRGESWIRKKLHQVKKQGRLIVGYGKREGLDGRPINVPVYAVK